MSIYSNRSKQWKIDRVLYLKGHLAVDQPDVTTSWTNES